MKNIDTIVSKIAKEIKKDIVVQEQKKEYIISRVNDEKQ